MDPSERVAFICSDENPDGFCHTGSAEWRCWTRTPERVRQMMHIVASLLLALGLFVLIVGTLLLVGIGLITYTLGAGMALDRSDRCPSFSPAANRAIWEADNTNSYARYMASWALACVLWTPVYLTALYEIFAPGLVIAALLISCCRHWRRGWRRVLQTPLVGEWEEEKFVLSPLLGFLIIAVLATLAFLFLFWATPALGAALDWLPCNVTNTTGPRYPPIYPFRVSTACYINAFLLYALVLTGPLALLLVVAGVARCVLSVKSEPEIVRLHGEAQPLLA